jgi:hypothetical protein
MAFLARTKTAKAALAGQEQMQQFLVAHIMRNPASLEPGRQIVTLSANCSQMVRSHPAA